MGTIYRQGYPPAVFRLLNIADTKDLKLRLLHTLVSTAINTGVYGTKGNKALAFNEMFYNEHIDPMDDYEEKDNDEEFERRIGELDKLALFFSTKEGNIAFRSSLASIERDLIHITDGRVDPDVTVETVLTNYYDIIVI